MKNLVIFVLISLGLASAITAPSYAGVPLNNLEGIGGVAFNPLAYTAGTPIGEPNQHREFSLDDVFTSKPQIGTWYINKNFLLVAVYVVTGNRTGTSAVGLDDGVVLSAQYTF